MTDIMGILCIDLGTSSIRAALRGPDEARVRVLEIGKAFGSSIDDASIPSAVFIPEDLSSVVFGEEALRKGLRGGKPFLFETSPKRWMTTGLASGLEAEVIHGTGVTQKILLAGLLAQAFSATATAANLTKRDIEEIEIRVAHPVWDGGRADSLREVLRWIASVAIGAAGVTDQPVTPVDLVRAINRSSSRAREGSIDVVEPVAAALDLFANSDNERELCLVVDVGAGTTDLALFLSLTPDSPTYRRKLVQAAAPKSMYAAGDVIDREVIRLIISRAKRLEDDDMRLLVNRRRKIKETLLTKGKVFEAGVEITASELEQEKNIHGMCSELAGHFRDLMSEAEGFISTHVTTGFRPVRELSVVFAGGGANIGFLHRAIGNSVTSNRRQIPVSLREIGGKVRGLPASPGRLAVVQGGTVPSEYWPVTALTPGRIRRI